MTQVELVLLQVACGNRPERLFVSGDTAQAIQEGVAFRFSDVREAAHHVAGRVTR